MNNERFAVVTGGTGGIGQAICAQFRRDGMVVASLGRRSPPSAAGTWQVDVTDAAAIRKILQEVVNVHGSIDVLVVGAGAGAHATIDDSPDRAVRIWDDAIAVNLSGADYTVAAAHHLRRPGARIILISSIAAFTGGSSAGGTGYAAAKAGVLGLMRGLVREFSPSGVTVNTIAPGFVPATGFFGPSPITEERVRSIVAQTPLGGAGVPDDVAAVAGFRASTAASFVNGVVAEVNGGWHIG